MFSAPPVAPAANNSIGVRNSCSSIPFSIWAAPADIPAPKAALWPSLGNNLVVFAALPPANGIIFKSVSATTLPQLYLSLPSILWAVRDPVIPPPIPPAKYPITAPIGPPTEAPAVVPASLALSPIPISAASPFPISPRDGNFLSSTDKSILSLGTDTSISSSSTDKSMLLSRTDKSILSSRMDKSISLSSTDKSILFSAIYAILFFALNSAIKAASLTFLFAFFTFCKIAWPSAESNVGSSVTLFNVGSSARLFSSFALGVMS